jgi:hypothetical protein
MITNQSSIAKRGIDLLRDPQLNKSTALTEAEREAPGLTADEQHDQADGDGRTSAPAGMVEASLIPSAHSQVVNQTSPQRPLVKG